MSAAADGTQPLYVYGLLESAFALTGGATDSPLGEGVGGASVRLMTASEKANALSALVSDIPAGPVAQTRRNMIAHTAVLERVMGAATILPVRFGTVAPDARALAGCIIGNTASMRAALREIDGRVELGVKASWREGVVFAEIVAGDPDLCQMRDRLRSRPANETYYERVELGRRVEAALANRRATDAATILATLTPLAERETELRALGEDMILNRAFLVKRENEARFDERMQAVAERHGDRVNFRYVGAVPPYNFVQLQAGWLVGVP